MSEDLNNNTTHPLSFDELSYSAQKYALSKYEPFMDYDWWDYIVDNWVEDMENEYGVGVDPDKVQWDDGFDVWYVGMVTDNEKFMEKLMPSDVAKSKSPYHRMEGEAEVENFWEDLHMVLTHGEGRNPSRSAMFLELDYDDDISNEFKMRLKSEGKKFAMERAAELGKYLREEWDYENSEEAAIEYFRNNDVRFGPDGKVWDEEEMSREGNWYDDED